MPNLQAHPVSKLLPNYPLRTQWDWGHGFCGELSIQQTALTHGVWVSQLMARELGGSELLIEDTLETAIRTLGFAYKNWSPSVGKPNVEAFMIWMKQQLIAGRAPIFGVQLKDGEMDPIYDHIVPAFGIRFDTNTANVYDPADRLIWTDDYG